MRILGVDPGTSVVGFGCIELRHAPARARSSIRNAVDVRGGLRQPRCVEAAAVRLGRRGDGIASRLLALGLAVEAWIARLRPDWLAVEEAFYGKSVQSALRIGEARGVILLVAARAGVAVAQYAPATIKRRVAGAGAASKDALARMVQLGLRPPPGRLPRDASDALAAALCHALASTARWLEPEAEKALDAGGAAGR